MKLSRLFISIAVLLVLQLMLGFWVIRTYLPEEPDLAEINSLAYSCAENYERKTFDRIKSSYNFTVIDEKGTLLYRTDAENSQTVMEAIKKRDFVIDIPLNKEQMKAFDTNSFPKLMIDSNIADAAKRAAGQMSGLLILVSIASGFILISYSFYLQKKVITPFKELKDFASRIAAGNLDLPLTMDRSNLFGAFTESFDIMREELKKAREQEYKVNQSKKELIAELSHDINTPVASIKTVAEVMALQAVDERTKKQITVIEEKANQIHTLVSNLFHGTLEELKELKVDAKDCDSRNLLKCIRTADYLNQAQIGTVPLCLVRMDQLRMQQVFDNIFANSYKYADTEMQVTFALKKNCFQILIRDFGPGIAEEEIPLIFNKFYRGKNSGEKSGAGLGLYISDYLLKEMGGRLSCENLVDGFLITIELKI